MADPTLQIVIVNRNSGPLVRRCLRSIASACREGVDLVDVTVVDDGSADSHLDGDLACDVPFRILRRPRSGYGASCNAAALTHTTDYVLFLNTDLFLEPDSLTKPLAFLEQPANADIGILGLQLRDENGEIARHCRRFPSLLDFLSEALGLQMVMRAFGMGPFLEFDCRSTLKVDQPIGAYMLMRGAIFRGLRGYDERFFVYYEDLDLTRRARSAGYDAVFFAGAWATHIGGATAKSVWAESIFFNLRSKLVFIVKWFGVGWGCLFFPLVYVVEPILRSGRSLLQGRARKAGAELAAMLGLWLNFPALVFRGPRVNWPF
jgi:GT2 family glycosyltransferase